MITRNYLGKLARPSAVFSGYMLLIFGAIAAYFSLMAILLIILGGIMAFSYSEVFIDQEGKQYKFQVMLFGFLPVGSWREFKPDDEIGLKHFKGKYTTYSRSNRQNSILVDDYRIYLTAAETKKKVTLGKFISEKEAIKEANRLMEIIQSLEKRENG